jgi:hypothetical protein
MACSASALPSSDACPTLAGHFDRARQLNPNDGLIAVYHAMWYCFVGRVEQAIASIEEA